MGRPEQRLSAFILLCLGVQIVRLQRVAAQSAAVVIAFRKPRPFAMTLLLQRLLHAMIAIALRPGPSGCARWSRHIQ